MCTSNVHSEFIGVIFSLDSVLPKHALISTSADLVLGFGGTKLQSESVSACRLKPAYLSSSVVIERALAQSVFTWEYMIEETTFDKHSTINTIWLAPDADRCSFLAKRIITPKLGERTCDV